MIAMYKDAGCTQRLEPNERFWNFPSDGPFTSNITTDYILVRPEDSANAAAWLAITGLTATEYFKMTPGIAAGDLGTISIAVDGTITRSGFIHSWDFEIVLVPTLPLLFAFVGYPAENITQSTTFYLKALDSQDYFEYFIRSVYNDARQANEYFCIDIVDVTATPNQTLNNLTGSLITGLDLANIADELVGQSLVLNGTYIGDILAGSGNDILIDNSSFSYTSSLNDWARTLTLAEYEFSLDGLSYAKIAALGTVTQTVIEVFVTTTAVIQQNAMRYEDTAIEIGNAQQQFLI